MSEAMTFEEVDEHVNKFAGMVASGHAKATADGAKALDPASVLKKVCDAWKIAKPVVSFLMAIPLIPAKWKAVVTSLTSLLDGICPAS